MRFRSQGSWGPALLVFCAQDRRGHAVVGLVVWGGRGEGGARMVTGAGLENLTETELFQNVRILGLL